MTLEPLEVRAFLCILMMGKSHKVHILTATPGHLLDHLEKTDCLLMTIKGKVETIALDESEDGLLDMMQMEQIVQIVKGLISRSVL